MSTKDVRISEILLDAHGKTNIVLELPSGQTPSPGQYLQAFSPTASDLDADAILPITLFPTNYTQSSDSHSQHLTFSGNIPSSWLPGTPLNLRGPLGNGFDLPDNLSRLALISLSDTTSRLLPLIPYADQIALFTDSAPQNLPEDVEINPLTELPTSISWPDFIAIDCPINKLETLSSLLPEELSQPPCPTQILIHSKMPCGSLADCGVCAVPAKRGYKLACKDGPVFDWEYLRF